MKAVIPVAGNGTRMRPFTKVNSKELFPFKGRAVIDYVVESLHEYAGVDDFIFVIGDGKSDLVEYLEDGNRYGEGVFFTYVYQREKKGLAHAIYQARHLINEDFIAHVGDSFIHPMSELTRMIEAHEESGSFATIIAPRVEDPTKYGVLKLDEEENLLDTIEKPTLEEARNFKSGSDYVVNMGIYCFSPRFFDYFEDTPVGKKDEYQVPDVLKTAMNKEELIKGVPTGGEYVDLGNWGSVEDAREYFNKEEGLIN